MAVNKVSQREIIEVPCSILSGIDNKLGIKLKKI